MGPAVERLRRQIRSREYVVDTEAVAEAMLRRRPELAEVSAGRPSAARLRASTAPTTCAPVEPRNKPHLK